MRRQQRLFKTALSQTLTRIRGAIYHPSSLTSELRSKLATVIKWLCVIGRRSFLFLTTHLEEKQMDQCIVWLRTPIELADGTVVTVIASYLKNVEGMIVEVTQPGDGAPPLVIDAAAFTHAPNLDGYVALLCAGLPGFLDNR
jgi:hypothetical protein